MVHPEVRRSGRVVSGVVGVLMVFAVVAVVVGSGTRTARPAALPATSVPPSTSTTAPAPSTTVAPVDLGRVSVTPAVRVDCGSTLPVSVVVPGAAEDDFGPAPFTPAPDHQVVRHWTAADRIIEVRWPADERQLQAPGVLPQMEPVLVESWGSSEAGAISAWGRAEGATGPLLFSLTAVPGVLTSALSRACSIVEVRVTMNDGNRETIGYRLPLTALGGGSVDLGPIVGLHRTSLAVVPRDRSSQCPDRVGSVATVSFQTPSPTPAEALQTFLDADTVLDLRELGGPNPFEETFLKSDGTYRYERFLGWSEYVAMTVDRMGDGWAVTNWEHGHC
jgi:hypothetical protein